MSNFDDQPKNYIVDFLGSGQFQEPHRGGRYSDYEGDPSILGDCDYQYHASWDIPESASRQEDKELLNLDSAEQLLDSDFSKQLLDLDFSKQLLDLDLDKELSAMAIRCPLLKSLMDEENQPTMKSGPGGGSGADAKDDKYVKECQQLSKERRRLEKSKVKVLMKFNTLEACAQAILKEKRQLEEEKLNLKNQQEDLDEQGRILENEKVAFESKRQAFLECHDDIMTYASRLDGALGQLRDIQF